MANVNFIELFKTKKEALSTRTSPIIQFHRNNGIQLIPNDEYPYIQSTQHPQGIELEDWSVEIHSICGMTPVDVTSYFMVERVYNDDNGVAQIEWSLTNVPYDFGSRFVYLEIEQLVGEKFYSNVFQLTSNDIERTARIDYKAKDSDTMHSICLQMYFWQNLKVQEITTYYETSTRNTVTALVKSQKHERWQTKTIANDLWIKITDAFENKYVYVDLIRSYAFEAMEVQEFEASENFKQNTFKISLNQNDIYDPLYAPPVIVDIPTIVLNSVTTNGFSAIYDFNVSNFNPLYLIYQYSQDMITWNSSTHGVNSPQTRPFNGIGTWYFRIQHPEAISNIITLELSAQVIANDDNSQVEKGKTIEIPVLLNDTLVGPTTITGVSIPSNGTVTIIDNETKIRYVHNDSVTTFDTFTYTISNGITSDTATVNVTIEDNTIPRYSITYSELEDISNIGVRYNDGTWKDRYLSSLESVLNNDGTVTSYVNSYFFPNIVEMTTYHAIVWTGGNFVLE